MRWMTEEEFEFLKEENKVHKKYINDNREFYNVSEDIVKKIDEEIEKQCPELKLTYGADEPIYISFEYELLNSITEKTDDFLKAKEISFYISDNLLSNYFDKYDIKIIHNKIKDESLVIPVEYNIKKKTLILNYVEFDKRVFAYLISLALRTEELIKDKYYRNDKELRWPNFKTVYQTVERIEFRQLAGYRISCGIKFEYNHLLRYRDINAIKLMRDSLSVYFLKQKDLIEYNFI